MTEDRSARPNRVLLVDVGSTRVKAAVVDGVTGAWLVHADGAMPHNVARRDTRYELDPTSLLATVTRVVEGVLADSDVPPDTAVMSTQMHSALLTGTDGQPVSPVITWQDNRLLEHEPDGRSRLEALLDAADLEAWARSGMAHRPGFGAGNLGAWLRENSGSHGVSRVHTIGSFLASAWGGPYATGLSNATSLGVIDLPAAAWSDELIDLHGLAACAFPEIVSESDPSARVTVAGVPMRWLGDVGDHQASVLGSGGLAPEEMAISLGTAGIASRVSAKPSTDTRVDTRPYFGQGYLLAVSRQPGGELAAAFAGVLADVAADVSGQPANINRVWDALASLPNDHVPGAKLDVVEPAPGTYHLSLQGVRSSAALQSMYTGLLNHYVDAYRDCLHVLFGADHAQVRRLTFNGGLAHHNERMRNRIAESLGLHATDVPADNLALEGLRTLAVRELATAKERS